MHGREGGENRKRSRHMWSTATGTVAPLDSNGSASANHLIKDGRKISVGDCALFKPAQDCPPFIGIIRSVTSDKENNLRLRVNWLYRPAEVILGKGVALEAAPNEVFYSFHSDEIPAASLLHPCKVAFLPKGLELPQGISSFVCRRVYDITSKCLWWLTDQDYIDDHQEEVDQLLYKTRMDMHGTAQQQQGARSPKSVNGSAAMSPLKSSPDSVQNSSSNLSSQTKGRKRDRGVQSSDPAEQEWSVRADGGDSAQFKSESMMKLEIAKIAEKGGLVDSEAVERLVQLMQPQKSEKKIDLPGRCLLAGIIAATDKDDCLSQFVQLRGLSVLDEWLQEVHKGKIGDPGNIKGSDKSVEDFLLVLLRALDKLPVNLNALKTCNIGKSVNHLRWHKNSEIQKKARSLVDIWKKRVEAEISINDAKSVSSQAVPWNGKSRHDGSHGGNRHSNGSSDAAIRSSVTHHSSLKSAPVKLVQGDSSLKPASAYQGVARSALSPTSTAANYKDGQSKISANVVSSELSQVVVMEERSSSPSQSHTNSQCFSDHAKNIALSVKEDAKSCNSSANGLHGTDSSVLQREAAPGRGASMAKISVVEKVSQIAHAAGIHEENNHKLIVKIPNRGRGPAQSIAAGSVDDLSYGSSRASSPALSEKHDQSDASLRGKHGTHPSSEVDGSLTSVQQRSPGDARGMPNVTKPAYLPSRNETKSRKAHDSSFSSMNALVESCVKFSESNASMSAGDDAGMNLLASVAAGEISTSGIASPAIAACRDPAAAGNPFSSCNGNKKQVHGDESMQQQCQSTDAGDADNKNTEDIPKDNDVVSNNQSGNENVHQNEEICLKSRVELDEQVGVASSVSTSRSVGEGCTGILSAKSSAIEDASHHDLAVVSQSGCWTGKDVKDESLSEESEKKTGRDAELYPSSNVDDEKNNVTQQLDSSFLMEQSSLVKASKSEATDTSEKLTMVSSSKPSFTSEGLVAGKSNEVKLEKGGVNVGEHTGLEGNKRLGNENSHPPVSQKREESGFGSTDKDQESNCMDKNVDDEEAHVHQSSNVAIPGTPCEVASPKAEVHLSSKESILTAAADETKGDSASATGSTAVAPAAGGSDIAAKLGFDLNEGLSADDGKSEPAHSSAGPCMDTVSSISPMRISVCSSSSGFSAAITVASAAKGPFVPPEDLLRNKRELGWKGSAATSAFRPAEPRKVTEVPLGSSKSFLPDAPTCKRARRPLDIDLNVADERVILDLAGQGSGQESNSKNNPVHGLTTTASSRSSGGLDLDLNRVDEAADVGYSGQRVDVPPPPIKASASTMYVNGEASGRIDFDLNNGPSTEETHVDQTLYNQHARGNIVFHHPFVPGNNGSVSGNCFAWYPPGSSFSVSMTPSSLPEEAFPVAGIGSGAQRVMGGPTSSLSFNHDDYKGSVFSSTPAMPFQSTPFQYPVFPFGTSLRLPTSGLLAGPPGCVDPAGGGRISAIPSQSVGTAAAVPFQYPQPYVVSRALPDFANMGMVESAQKWGTQGLDLNSGPGGVVDTERRDESQPTVSRQLSAISSHSLAEEQARMYNMEGGGLKRKEPEGGRSMDNLNFRPSSWR